MKIEVEQNKEEQTISVIDYEKLTQAITNAILQCEEEKQKNKYPNLSDWMKVSMHTILWSLGIVLAITAISALIVAVKTIGEFANNPYITIGKFLFLFICALSFGGMSINTFFSSKEIENVNDKYFLTNVFSSVISFVALIVALIALFKGVH